MPNKAVMRLHVLIILMKCNMRLSSPQSKISAMCFTALNDRPRLVACDINVIAELKSDTRPMPDGPSNRATSLLRTSPMMMFRPCTPPKMPVYFSTWL